MQKETFLRGLKQILISLSDQELRELISWDILNRLNVPHNEEHLMNAKTTFFERIKDMGIEQLQEAKETFSKTVAKIDERMKTKKRPKDVEEIVKLKNNPFLKVSNQK